VTLAGKEPAEDVKRAIRRAIELAGLEVHEVRMFKAPNLDGRIVLSGASPTDWPYEQPAISLITVVGFNGSVGKIEIRCSASDGDPLMEVFNAPHLQQCTCQLSDLPATLKEVWVARREVIAKMHAGEKDPIFDGRWTWAIGMNGLS
jgi:hypothetical protein